MLIGGGEMVAGDPEGQGTQHISLVMFTVLTCTSVLLQTGGEVTYCCNHSSAGRARKAMRVTEQEGLSGPCSGVSPGDSCPLSAGVRRVQVGKGGAKSGG